MNRKTFNSIIILASVLAICLIGTSAMGQTESGGMNPLREEMLALEEVFEIIIDAVIFDNMELITPRVPSIREARKKFKEVISTGRKIELPKNKKKFEEFVELDDKFQIDFGILEEAAEKGQKEVVKDKIHKLFDACVVCHERFRK